jgi:hypothetical protein
MNSTCGECFEIGGHHANCPFNDDVEDTPPPVEQEPDAPDEECPVYNVSWHDGKWGFAQR